MSRITRRTFTTAAAGALLTNAAPSARPNILWITTEDIGPDLHACGQSYAVTPNLDALVKRSLLYGNAWSNAPVCAPARTTIISGLYPTSTGSEHMRSTAKLPSAFQMFPQYLRAAGYYCTNNEKEDYNLSKPGQVWDESSKKAHWRGRASDQPFFSVFNHMITHESQIRTRPHRFVHDPAKAPLPAYHPDTPEVRQDWAQYYDNITTMDGQAGQLLEQLQRDGLMDDTIIFFYGDHGSGMPGKKRSARNAGLNVSIVLSIPEKFRSLAPPEYGEGARSDRMVGFIDLAPTVLSLTGVKPPEHFQGEAFAGKYQAKERKYNFGFRGRMDERYDLVRTVRDKKYVYIRNYMPHKPAGQFNEYMFQTPTTQVWKRLYDEGKLNQVQSQFWNVKPAEELYDLTSDSDEVKNLAGLPAHKSTLIRLRDVQQQWIKQVHDVGFLPEGEIHSRSSASSPWEMGHSPRQYPMERIVAQAEMASSLKAELAPKLADGLNDFDSAVRYWSALGFVILGPSAVHAHRKKLLEAVTDHSPYVRIAVAEAIGVHGGEADDATIALEVLMKLAPSGENEHYASLLALNAIDALGPKAKPRLSEIRTLSTTDPKVDNREKAHCESVRKRIVSELA